MARTVADAAALLNVLVGADPADGATAASRGKVAADYTSFLDANGLKGARIGLRGPSSSATARKRTSWPKRRSRT